MDDQTKPQLSAKTILAQGYAAHEPVPSALVPPIHMSATYLRDADNGYSSGYIYGRTDNPSVQQAENLIAELERADEALLFGSGMAAATSVLLALDKPTHIIASQVMYWGFRSWLREIGRYGHRISFVETSDLDAVRAAVRPGETGLFWIETPSNPLWTITDIAATAQIAHAAGAVLASIRPSPRRSSPGRLRSAPTSSCTRRPNILTAIPTSSPARSPARARPRLWARIRKVRQQLGSALGPFDAWLLMRGMRTLDVRVRAAGAEPRRHWRAVCRTSRRRPPCSIPASPIIPATTSPCGRCRAASAACCRSASRSGETAAIAVAAAVELWKRATSLGGVESLIEHRASIEGAGSPVPRRPAPAVRGPRGRGRALSGSDRALETRQ